MLNAAAASWLELSGARTGRPSSLLVELQVKVVRASWLSVVGSARQGAASRQMRPLANETKQSPQANAEHDIFISCISHGRDNSHWVTVILGERHVVAVKIIITST